MKLTDRGTGVSATASACPEILHWFKISPANRPDDGVTVLVGHPEYDEVEKAHLDGGIWRDVTGMTLDPQPTLFAHLPVGPHASSVP